MKHVASTVAVTEDRDAGAVLVGATHARRMMR
jgi:hypothetical protein